MGAWPVVEWVVSRLGTGNAWTLPFLPFYSKQNRGDEARMETAP